MKENENTGWKDYSVSEAVQKSGVPSHVLRYWEDELHLTIRRTAQGHRIYSEEDIATFQWVKELKEKGIQLKAIRLLLENSGNELGLESLLHEKEGPSRTEYGGVREESEEAEYEGVRQGTEGIAYKDIREESEGTVYEDIREETEENAYEGIRQEDAEAEYEVIPAAEADNYLRFESMLRNLISETVAEQNEKLERDFARMIRDELEDFYIQVQQETARREAAASAAKRNVAAKNARAGLLKRLRNAINEAI
ncbi:MAG: helix-turn-helix domain-containing protein [Lachnospiraceae bacterium]|nr:helix-turn-helix domain-containing protein [Lachnospiraceae bacterium]